MLSLGGTRLVVKVFGPESLSQIPDLFATSSGLGNLADFPAVFFHISDWYLSWTTDKSKL